MISITTGRPIVFTPERMEQIRNLVERGMSREEIAEMVGSTLGSLQVTCSKMGVSLRRPPTLSPPKREARVETKTNGDKNETVTMTISIGQKTKTFELPRSVLADLCIEAEILDIGLTALIIKKLKGE